MKLFEEQRAPRDGAMVLRELFNTFTADEVSIPSKTISPSSLGCQVACAYKLTGTTPEPEKRSFQSGSFADAGEDRHKRIQAFLSKTEYWVNVVDYVAKKKVPVDVIVEDGYEVLLQHKELPIRFKCDGMLKIDDEYYILEIKTERMAANISRTTYDPKHQPQGITYATIMNTDKILWLYEGRDTLEQKTFVQEVTKEDKANILKYIKQIVENKDKPELLQRNEKGCTYCNYKKHCKAYFKQIKKE